MGPGVVVILWSEAIDDFARYLEKSSRWLFPSRDAMCPFG
jgi:hypothetical protein